MGRSRSCTSNGDSACCAQRSTPKFRAGTQAKVSCNQHASILTHIYYSRIKSSLEAIVHLTGITDTSKTPLTRLLASERMIIPFSKFFVTLTIQHDHHPVNLLPMLFIVSDVKLVGEATDDSSWSISGEKNLLLVILAKWLTVHLCSTISGYWNPN